MWDVHCIARMPVSSMYVGSVEEADTNELDEHEDTDTAQDRHHATHMLNTAIHSAALPGGAALKLPRDWVMFGDTAKWHTKRPGASISTARVLDLEDQDQPSLDDLRDQ